MHDGTKLTIFSKTLNLLASNRVAIVVPAFELNESGVAITYYPETKYELVDLYYQGKVQQVRILLVAFASF